MSKIRYKLKNESALAMLSAFEAIWSTFSQDEISSETADSYYSFIKNIERDINLPRIDTIIDYEIFIIGENAD